MTEVVACSHGWLTTLNEAVQQYTTFGAGLTTRIGRSASRVPVLFHWPSTLSEDSNVPVSVANLGSYYVMQSRADIAGKDAFAEVLRKIVRAQKGPLLIRLIGHSFGTRVICSALETLAVEGFDLSHVQFKIILLQAAFGCDALEPGRQYGNVSKIGSLTLLASKSDLDAALCRWYPEAQKIDPLHLMTKGNAQALGAVGPTPATRQAFGDRLSVADLTPVHKLNEDKFKGFGGSHSDVFNDGVYDLVSRF